MDNEEIRKEKMRGEYAKKWQEQCKKIDAEVKEQEEKNRKASETKKSL